MPDPRLKEIGRRLNHGPASTLALHLIPGGRALAEEAIRAEQEKVRPAVFMDEVTTRSNTVRCHPKRGRLRRTVSGPTVSISGSLPQPNRLLIPESYARARRNVRGGWWAEVGTVGSAPTERKACATRRGALWSAWRMSRRWYGS